MFSYRTLGHIRNTHRIIQDSSGRLHTLLPHWPVLKQNDRARVFFSLNKKARRK
jgi:hypothetical protein